MSEANVGCNDLLDGRPIRPCPFCGAGAFRLEEKTAWTGMRSKVVSARVMHWCERKDRHPQSLIQIAGPDADAAVALWNERAATSNKMSTAK